MDDGTTISKKALIAELGVSVNTYKKWAKAWHIATDKQELTQTQADHIRHAQQRTQGDRLSWDEYLLEIEDQIPTDEPEPVDLISELLPRYRAAGQAIGAAIASEIIHEIDQQVFMAIADYAKSNPLRFETVEAELVQPIAIAEGE